MQFQRCSLDGNAISRQPQILQMSWNILSRTAHPAPGFGWIHLDVLSLQLRTLLFHINPEHKKYASHHCLTQCGWLQYFQETDIIEPLPYPQSISSLFSFFSPAKKTHLLWFSLFPGAISTPDHDHKHFISVLLEMLWCLKMALYGFIVFCM